MKWKVTQDEALVLYVDGKGVAGIWRGAWKIGRHKPNPKAVTALMMASAITGMSMPTGPRDVLEYGYLAAIWDPYERLSRFTTVPEAKQAVEKALRDRRG